MSLSKSSEGPQGNALKKTDRPATIPIKVPIAGMTLLRTPFAPPALVPPRPRVLPLFPFDVARRVASIVTVFFVCVITVVGYVAMLSLTAACCAESEKKTRAAPGAGTLIWHEFFVWSHWTVWTDSSPFQRPSDWKRAPSVCPKERRC